MRIISPFKDYYDCLQSVDEDRETLFIRNPKDEVINNWPFYKRDGFFYSICLPYQMNFTIKSYIIGFCNKIYIIFEFNELCQDNRILCHTIEDVDKIFEICPKKFKNKYWEKNKKSWKLASFSRSKFLARFEEVNKNKHKFEYLFEQYDTPIFVTSPGWYMPSVNGYTLTTNVNLEEYEFYRVLNIHNAYRELLMYINNKAQPERPIPEVSNSDMIITKGFHPKYSFRKPPTK